MSALYLCGITSAGKEDTLRDLIEPIYHLFDGLIWVFHHPADEGAGYLESRRRAGHIIYVHFSGRHGSSMTQYLHQGPMQDGDHFVQLDDLERLSPAFCAGRLPGLVKLMQETDTAMIAHYGKGLIFRFNEQLEFKGSPHWYPVGLDGTAVSMELPSDEVYNVRAQYRTDPYQWVTHYLKYWLYPAGSNHALLGLEKQGNPQVLFPAREARRLAFRAEIKRRGYPLTVDGVKAALSQPLDPVMRDHVNADKTVNDYYRYAILGDRTVVDTHLPSDMRVV